MSDKIIFKVPLEYDNFLALHFLKGYCKISARMITQLKRTENGITQDGKLLRTVDKVFAGSEVVLNLPEDETEINPVCGNLDILYEDDYILLVNKPFDMPVHPVKQHQNDTLANFVTYYSHEKGENYTFRAINRLDKDTSGIVFIAKDRYIANAIKNSIVKTYYALCEGIIKENGTIDAKIALKENSKMVREVTDRGQRAVTHYKVIKTNDKFSLLEINLETGRTHQIRCHMSSIGFPLAGDDLYGGSIDFIKRQALHCGKMDFVHPITSEKISIKAPLPKDIENLIF